MGAGIPIKNKNLEYNLQSWSKQNGLNPLEIERAEDIYFYTFDGERYSDMSSQLVNMNLGHSNKEIINAIKTQMESFCFVGPSYAAQSRTELSKKVISLMPDNFGKIFFVNSGTEANEDAIKIARMYTGKTKIFSRYRSYHGSTLGSGNLTGEVRRFACEPGIPGFVKFFDPYIYREQIHFESDEALGSYYVAKLREQIEYEGPESIAAIFLEFIPGSNGVLIPPSNYLPGVRELCDEYGILMIADEVMTGFGRTGTMFSFENWGVKPDLITFAKGVNSGYIPLGGVAVSNEIAAYFDDNVLSCGHTYSGHPLACAAGVACLDYMLEKDIVGNVKAVGKVLGEILEGYKEKYDCVGDVRYIGLFACIEFVKSKSSKEPLVPYGKDPEGKMKSIIGMLSAKKFMTYTHDNNLIIAPPLIITEEQIREEMEKMDEVLAEVQRTLV